MDAISVKGMAVVVHEERCLDCGSCVKVCPVQAIVTIADAIVATIVATATPANEAGNFA